MKSGFGDKGYLQCAATAMCGERYPCCNNVLLPLGPPAVHAQSPVSSIAQMCNMAEQSSAADATFRRVAGSDDRNWLVARRATPASLAATSWLSSWQ